MVDTAQCGGVNEDQIYAFPAIRTGSRHEQTVGRVNKHGRDRDLVSASVSRPPEHTNFSS